MEKPKKMVLTEEEGLGYRHYQMDREYVDTWNSCYDQWEAYHKEEMIRVLDGLMYDDTQGSDILYSFNKRIQEAKERVGK